MAGGSGEAMRELRHSCWGLFRYHAHDWVALVLLAILEGCLLLVVHPFRRFVSEYTINDLRFPVRSFTVPIAALVVISIVIPMLVIVAYFLYKRDPHDLHHGLLGLFFAVMISGAITDALKTLTGRPRPDFFWRCFPDGVPHYTADAYRKVLCTGNPGEVRQGYKSFPSGHSSWSFSGLGYLALYLTGKVKVFDRKGRVIKMLLAAVPLIGATLVAISIVNDYWHHWEDAFAGAILGFVVAVLCYRQYFPSVFDERCSNPYPFASGAAAANGRCISEDVEAGTTHEHRTEDTIPQEPSKPEEQQAQP